MLTSHLAGTITALSAAVVGVPHEHWSEAVTAVVVAKPGARVSEAELIEHCRQRLGG